LTIGRIADLSCHPCGGEYIRPPRALGKHLSHTLVGYNGPGHVPKKCSFSWLRYLGLG